MAGGPRGGGHPPRRRGLRSRPARDGHQPDVADVVAVAVVVTDRRERDRAPVGRPRGIGVVVVALGELARIAAVGGHHEDLRAPVVGEALAVEPVLHGGDHARAASTCACPPRTRARAGRPPAPRRRGGCRRATIRARSAPCRRSVRRTGSPPAAGITWSWPFLPRLALGDERQAGAVGRPARGGVPPRAGREPAGLAAGRAHHPDVREILVLLLGERRDHEGDRPAVRRDLGIADEADAGEILRHHGARGGHGAHDPPAAPS